MVQQALPGPALNVLQIAQRRGDPAVRQVGGRRVELRENAADVLVRGTLGDEQPLGDGGVPEALGHPG